MTGSGMSTAKQLLLSIVATTISIVLTFGTAIWLEKGKKEEAKREMVMMILYDLTGSIEQAEQADSMLRECFEQQVAVAENPKLLEQNPFIFTLLLARCSVSYTETVEHIFSSNIETINTLGNVLFAENVSNLYRLRREYQQQVCQQLAHDVETLGGCKDYSQVMAIDFAGQYILISGMLLNEMKEKLAQCQQMMDVSNTQLEAYRQKRQDMMETSASDSISKALLEEMNRNYQRLQEAQN